MQVIYHPSVLLHNRAAINEGAYRLDGVEGIATVITDLQDPTKEILSVHSKKHLQKIKEACDARSSLAEVQVSPESYIAAMHSVALSIYATKTNDFAITRPPGHHARRQSAAGFCLFNNVAIATQTLVDQGKKVLIIDFDGHHGDGTQKIFYHSNQVFYTSIHSKFAYPFKATSSDQKGAKKGKGFNLNIPLMPGSTDNEFLSALEQIITATQHFSPDVVAVSAGFDGYYKDTLLDLSYTMNGFFSAGAMIKEMDLPTFAVLEGGYHPDVMKCVKSFVDGYNKK